MSICCKMLRLGLPVQGYVIHHHQQSQGLVGRTEGSRGYRRYCDRLTQEWMGACRYVQNFITLSLLIVTRCVQVAFWKYLSLSGRPTRNTLPRANRHLQISPSPPT